MVNLNKYVFSMMLYIYIYFISLLYLQICICNHDIQDECAWLKCQGFWSPFQCSCVLGFRVSNVVGAWVIHDSTTIYKGGCYNVSLAHQHPSHEYSPLPCANRMITWSDKTPSRLFPTSKKCYVYLLTFYLHIKKRVKNETQISFLEKNMHLEYHIAGLLKCGIQK